MVRREDVVNAFNTVGRGIRSVGRHISYDNFKKALVAGQTVGRILHGLKDGGYDTGVPLEKVDKALKLAEIIDLGLNPVQAGMKPLREQVNPLMRQPDQTTNILRMRENARTTGTLDGRPRVFRTRRAGSIPE